MMSKNTLKVAADLLRQLGPANTSAANVAADLEKMGELKAVAYLDPVDRGRVYVAPPRKEWLAERDDKEWLSFHESHKYDIPLYCG